LFSQNDLVKKITITIKGYSADGLESTSLETIVFYYCDFNEVFPTGILDKQIKVLNNNQTQSLFVPMHVRTTTAVGTLEQMEVLYYLNGVLHNTTVLENLPYPDYFFYSLMAFSYNV